MSEETLENELSTKIFFSSLKVCVKGAPELLPVKKISDKVKNTGFFTLQFL